MNDPAKLREHIRHRYAQAAASITTDDANLLLAESQTSSCCTSDAGEQQPAGTCEDQRLSKTLYATPALDQIPTKAIDSSLGCGNPVAVAALHEGERVLDLGSGGGLDVLLSAKRVGPSGYVYGVDMTDEMLTLANANKAQSGIRNVEFRKGTIEHLPLPDQVVDVVISNCVINLSTDKPAALSEIFRVLIPGGRIGISDIVAEDHLNHEQRAAQGTYVGCIAGALSRTEYINGLTAAGFIDIEVDFTHKVADEMHAAIIRAKKPMVEHPRTL